MVVADARRIADCLPRPWRAPARWRRARESLGRSPVGLGAEPPEVRPAPPGDEAMKLDKTIDR